MTVSINTRGFVLRTMPFRERDRLYTVFTKEVGKQQIHAVSARKLSSKLAGSMEPFAEIEVYMIQAKLWPKLGGAVVHERFSGIHNTLASLHAAQFISEIVDKTTTIGLADYEQYELLHHALQWLNNYEAHRIMPYSFVVKWASVFGSDLSQYSEEVSENIAKVFRWLAASNYTEIVKLRLEQADWNLLHRIVMRWLEDHAAQRIQSERFLV